MLDDHPSPYCIPGSPEEQAYQEGLQGIERPGSSNSTAFRRGKEEREAKQSSNIFDSNSPSPPTSSNNNCFVTTATYGDGNHPMVQEFRGFRDQVLAETKSGRAFIDWYYENGPQMAAVLDEKPALKAPVRTILTPLAFTARAFRKMNGRELSKR